MVLILIFAKAFLATLLMLLNVLFAAVGVCAGVAAFVLILTMWQWPGVDHPTTMPGRAA